jgi:hypothetical protein
MLSQRFKRPIPFQIAVTGHAQIVEAIDMPKRVGLMRWQGVYGLVRGDWGVDHNGTASNLVD